MSVAQILLRIFAILGPIAVVGCEVASLSPLVPRQWWGIIVLLVMGLAAAGFLFVVAPRALGTILRHPDLLVPLGVITTLSSIFGWLTSLTVFAPLARPFWNEPVLGLSMVLSVALIGWIALAVLLAGWTTSLVLQAVETDRVDLLAPFLHPGRWLVRTFVAQTIGIVGLLLLLVVAIATARAQLTLGLIMMAAMSLGWSFFTAALLPAALASRGSLVESLRDGFRASRQGLGRWWHVILLQLLLLGWVTFIHLSYTSTQGNTTTTYTATNWNVNGFWVGGYERGCRWYDQVAAAGQTRTLPPIVTLLALLFGVVAVAVKLTIAQRMRPAQRTEDDGAREVLAESFGLRQCPACGADMPANDAMCFTCGWMRR